VSFFSETQCSDAVTGTPAGLQHRGPIYKMSEDELRQNLG